MSNLRSPEGIKCRSRHKAKGIFHSRDEFECLLSLHLALRITLGKAGCTIWMKAQESFLVSRIYLPIGTKGRSLCSNLLPCLPQLNWSEEFNPTKNRNKKFITRLDDSELSKSTKLPLVGKDMYRPQQQSQGGEEG
jgi:hypothetical protein